MKIAYVTTYDSSDVGNWSGLGYFIPQALERHGIEVCRIGPITASLPAAIRAKVLFHRHVTGKHYQIDRVPQIVKLYGEQVSQRLKGLDVDVVLSPGTIPISLLECRQPIVFWTDATYAAMTNYYPGHWSNLCEETISNGNRMEQAALSNSRMALYSSAWAADSATSSYDVRPANKVRVIPFGANIERAPHLGEITNIAHKRSRDGTCRLLFLGVDWFRKGGDTAIELVKSLVEKKVKAELTIVGSSPTYVPPDFVHLKGFVSKRTAEGRAILSQLLVDSHFLVLPSRADCSPVVIAEANAHGVPVVATNVGGIPSAIRDHINGCCFPARDFVGGASRFILESFGNPAAYRQLSLSAFGEYEARLNWNVAARRVKDCLEECVGWREAAVHG